MDETDGHIRLLDATASHPNENLPSEKIHLQHADCVTGPSEPEFLFTVVRVLIHCSSWIFVNFGLF